MTWCQETKAINVVRPKLKYAREMSGRTRWLTQDELRAFFTHCPPTWAPLFKLLFATGMTIGEALGLRRADIDVKGRRVALHEQFGRTLKRKSRARELSVPTPVDELLKDWLRDHVAE
jgi:integrase